MDVLALKRRVKRNENHYDKAPGRDAVLVGPDKKKKEEARLARWNSNQSRRRVASATSSTSRCSSRLKRGVVGVAQAAASACFTHPRHPNSPTCGGGVCAGGNPQGQNFHFAQAVRGMGEQLSLDWAQGMGRESSQLTCAGTALDSKSESESESARIRERRPAFCVCQKAALWCTCAGRVLSRGCADLRRATTKVSATTGRNGEY